VIDAFTRCTQSESNAGGKRAWRGKFSGAQEPRNLMRQHRRHLEAVGHRGFAETPTQSRVTNEHVWQLYVHIVLTPGIVERFSSVSGKRPGLGGYELRRATFKNTRGDPEKPWRQWAVDNQRLREPPVSGPTTQPASRIPKRRTFAAPFGCAIRVANRATGQATGAEHNLPPPELDRGVTNAGPGLRLGYYESINHFCFLGGRNYRARRNSSREACC